MDSSVRPPGDSRYIGTPISGAQNGGAALSFYTHSHPSCEYVCNTCG